MLYYTVPMLVVMCGTVAQNFVNMMHRVKISLLAVDESHCISQVRIMMFASNYAECGPFSGAQASVQSI